MITATEHARYLGYTLGYDLPLDERRTIIALDRTNTPQAARRLDKIIADHRPDCPRGLRVLTGDPSYTDTFRAEFLAGATAPGTHRKLIDA